MREVTFYEKALVGAVLNDASVMEVVGDHLLNHLFVDPVCGTVFCIAYELRTRGCSTLPKDVMRRAIETGRDSELSMLELNRLSIEDACINQSVGYYLDQIVEIDGRYATTKALKQAMEMLEKSDVPLKDVYAHIDSCKNKTQVSKLNRISIKDAVKRVAEEARKEKIHALMPCKVGSLDKILGGGFHTGELSVVAARPSVGKTSFAAQAAFNMSSTAPVLFISLEMSADDIARRCIAHLGGPSFAKLRGTISVEDFGACLRVPIKGHEFYISESRSVSLSAIIAQIRSAKAACGIRAVVIDYLGYVSHDRRLKRNEDVGIITKELKQVANAEQLSMIVLSQLNRDKDSSDRPSLRDLRESGDIEQDADLVLFIYRDADDESGNSRIFEVAKNRNGELLETRMKFIGERFMFGNKEEWVA